MKFIHSDKAPAAVGAYSQAVQTRDLVFISGQLPFNPTTGKIEHGNIAGQTKQVLANIDAILLAAGLTKKDVVKTTILITNVKDDFQKMNQVYAEYFGEHKPARAAFEVSDLYAGALIEIETIATTIKE